MERLSCWIDRTREGRGEGETRSMERDVMSEGGVEEKERCTIPTHEQGTVDVQCVAIFLGVLRIGLLRRNAWDISYRQI